MASAGDLSGDRRRVYADLFQKIYVEIGNFVRQWTQAVLSLFINEKSGEFIKDVGFFGKGFWVQEPAQVCHTVWMLSELKGRYHFAKFSKLPASDINSTASAVIGVGTFTKLPVIHQPSLSGATIFGTTAGTSGLLSQHRRA